MNTNRKKVSFISNEVNNNQFFINKEIEKKKNDPNYICIDCFFYTFYMKIEDYEKYKIIPNPKYNFLRKN